MSALAIIALKRGLNVTGSDSDVSGCGDLVHLGAQVRADEAVELAGAARAVVVSAAIPDRHADLEAARARGVPLIARKDALAELVAGGRCIGIAGTHGKTTTTAMTTEAVAAAGFQVTGIAGGRVDSWGGNARIAGSEHDLYVVEADEYDRAFLALNPEIAVITNVEPDHLECYGSVEALEAAFADFARVAERTLVGNDSAGAERVAGRLPAGRVWRFGPGAPDLNLGALDTAPHETRATLTLPGEGTVPLRLRIPGVHNLRNATAALGVVVALGGNPRSALGVLAEFRGVGRRFDRRGEIAGVAIVDDYAHHPTEIRATLLAARQAYPARRLVAVFQPHLYSRTEELGREMGAALARADLAVITDVFAAREEPIPGVTGELVARAAADSGGNAVYEPDRAALAGRVAALVEPGDLLLTLGAGDITRLGREVEELLRPVPGPP